MRNSATTPVLLLLALLFPAAAIAQEIDLQLKKTKTGFTANDGTITVPIPITGQATLRVTCHELFDCRKVEMGGPARERVQETEKSPTARVFVVPGGKGAIEFRGRIVHDGKESENELEFRPQANGNGNSEALTLPKQVAQWLATECRLTTDPKRSGAHIAMTPFGGVLWRSGDHFDDEEILTVSVFADNRLHHLLDVRMTTELAQPVITNIYAGDQAPFKEQGRRGTDSSAAKPPACSFTRPEPVGPFASPKGGLQVTIYDGEAVKDLGTTQFVVAPLYTGTFTLGGISTRVSAPTFAKAFDGTDTVIVARETGRRILYTAMYTRFWQKRDLRRGPRDVIQAITPMVGVVLNDVAKNALVGASIELRPGLAAVIGKHFGRVDVLDESTGAAIGKEFENRGDVPVDKAWRNDWFYGISVDVRAAAALLRSVISPAS